MYGCESWTVKKAEHRRIDAFELWCWRRLLSPLDYKEIQPVHPKGDQPWDSFGRNDGKAETPVLWPPHVKSWLIGKDSDGGRDSGQEEKGMTEDEMAGWHHRLDAHEFGWTPEVGDGQGGLACCDSWGHKESDTTGQLNWTETEYTIGEEWRNEGMKDSTTEGMKDWAKADITHSCGYGWWWKLRPMLGTWNVRSMNQGKLK